MRKITRQLVLLFVVFVIYFGYSAFIDGASLLHTIGGEYLYEIHPHGGGAITTFTINAGSQMGSNAWNGYNIIQNLANGKWFASIIIESSDAFNKAGQPIAQGTTLTVPVAIGGFMAPTSLLYTILSPFKLVLVGGVFALLVPLTKQIFFGTVIGIKDYIKTRRTNVLYNYQTAIDFAVNMNAKLVLGDYEQIKSQYSAFKGLAFKPLFMINMMDEIGDGLIRETDLKPYIKPSETVIVALKEMYEKERKALVLNKPSEMFFDFKRGYEYISIGSKYSIAYYKALQVGEETPKKLGWKLFSLEMFRFYVFMLLAVIPTVIVSLVILPLIAKFTSFGDEASMYIIAVTFFGSAVIFHACFTLTKPVYKNMLKNMIVPAVIYYGLMIVLAVTFASGILGIQQIGDISSQGTSSQLMWPFFSALGYTVLSTCLIMYIIATLMDSNRNPLGMNKKIIIDGMILPAIAWAASSGVNFIGPIAGLTPEKMGLFSGISFGILIGFWVYLSVSGIVLNNIVMPTFKKKLAIQNELAQQGKEANDKKETVVKETAAKASAAKVSTTKAATTKKPAAKKPTK